MRPLLVFPQDVPHESASGKYIRYGGMTLRDYFAAQALSKAYIYSGPSDGPEGRLAACHHLATWAYALADAMMEERAKDEKR